MYIKGIGVNKNIREGISWCKKAAEDGDLEAQLNMVRMYSNGVKGYLERDREKARYWMSRAEQQGYMWPAKIQMGDATQ